MMFDFVVIGTGAGLMVAEKLARAGQQVAVVEKGKFGGTCLTRGCIPSKMLVYPADLIREAERAHKVGVSFDKPQVDWEKISSRVWERIDVSKAIEESFGQMDNITLFVGEGRFTGPNSMTVKLNAGGEAALQGKRFLIATGGRTHIPPIKGLEETGYLTSERFFGPDYPKRPYESLVIAGGGTIAVEFAHIFAAMGAKVTILGRNPRLLPMEDEEISEKVLWQLRDYGIDVYTGFEVLEASAVPEGKRITARNRSTGESVSVTAQEFLLAAGIVPETDRLGLDAAGVKTDDHGWIQVNEYLETNQPHIYALGDVIGGHLFRHKANYQADLLSHNLLTEGPRRKRDERATPWAVFTAPQVGHVGLTEREVRALGKPYYLGRYRYHMIAAGMAMAYEAEDGDNGLVKLLLDEDLKILGVHIVGFQAAALVQPFVYLMNAGQGLGDTEAGTLKPLMRSMVIHPTLSELAAWSIEEIDWAQPIRP